MGPYKCPDCGVWWAGLEHRCRSVTTDNTPVPLPYPYVVPFVPSTAGNATFCTSCHSFHTGPCTNTWIYYGTDGVTSTGGLQC